MQKLTDDVQHELERGVILDVLILANLEWLPIRSVRSQLAGQGFFLADRELQFHFNYLEQRGYIDRKPLRSGRADLELQVVRANTKAVDLHDGRIPPDEGIKF
jgi:repressor of nif and glnA expression